MLGVEDYNFPQWNLWYRKGCKIGDPPPRFNDMICLVVERVFCFKVGDVRDGV
jgi:hypothetical protein